MSGILLVTSKIQESPSGGRELLSKLNRDVLKDLYGDNLVVVEVQRKSLRGILATANAFKGYIDGLDAEACAMVCSFVHSRDRKVISTAAPVMDNLQRSWLACFHESILLYSFTMSRHVSFGVRSKN